MFRFSRLSGPAIVTGGTVAVLTVALASCAPKVVRRLRRPAAEGGHHPPKPMPPNGASNNLAFPAADANGLRESVNRNISPSQMLWNLRSAYNVAALNCNEPKHANILVRYRAFLKNHARTLTAANKKVDEEFRKKYGARFTAPREQYMTAVYNHFALPPTLPHFCDAVLAVSEDGEAVKSVDLEAFAVRSLPNIEVVFDDFYRRYEQYRIDLAAWQAQYGQPWLSRPRPWCFRPLRAAERAPRQVIFGLSSAGGLR
jgi:hypothetical protein